MITDGRSDAHGKDTHRHEPAKRFGGPCSGRATLLVIICLPSGAISGWNPWVRCSANEHTFQRLSGLLFGGMGKPVSPNGFSEHFPITMTVTEVD
jgi:hypothetical protein